MHAGAAYYDAFWMETCVGHNLKQYFQDAMDDEPFWYLQIGETIKTRNGVVFRYSAHCSADSIAGEPLYYGAEILEILDNKILTVTDMYCSPDRSNLIEIAELASKRHGLTSFANSGLGALKAARIKANLSVKNDKEQFYRDPDITISRLAEEIGCTLQQLSAVLESQFGASFGAFVDTRRVEYAKELLQHSSDDPDILEKVATSAGFRSLVEFRRTFGKVVGVTPATFFRQQQQKKLSDKDSSLQ
jgi:AraC-like DNA-binding protein